MKAQDIITEDTLVPEMPSDLIKLLDEQKVESQINKLKDEIESLKKEQGAFIEKTI